jgi:selenocysteine lyase/cysteine desulfurase
MPVPAASAAKDSSALPTSPALASAGRRWRKWWGWRSQTWRRKWERLRGKISASSAAVGEIAMVENATVAWQHAFYGVAQDFQPGDRILTAACEYAANYVAYLQVAARTGCVVEVIRSLPNGETSPAALEEMIDDKVKLISITHAPTNGGLVNDAVAIGKIAKAHGIVYLLDACQTVGQMPLDVKEIGCDLLSATGRKYLRGPRGSVFLFCSQALLDGGITPPIIDHHGSSWVRIFVVFSVVLNRKCRIYP